MAIYHFSAKIISRKSGRSAVAAAAYRAAERLYEDSSGITHDYSRKEGVEHSEILKPDHAPDWMSDRATLWNAVESCEKRRDAQLARDLEVGLPVELDREQQIELMRGFVQREFVDKGMVADFSIHRDNENNPHAHILLTTREVTEEGFGKKARHWNSKEHLLNWRAAWAEHTNEHLARAGYAIRIDHRSYRDQGLDLTPGRKIGISRAGQSSPGLSGYLADRVAEQRDIARENGNKILQDPNVALQAITHYQATFSHEDIAKFLHTHTEGAEQFQAAYLKVTTSKELVPLGTDERNRVRFTTREMLKIERDLFERADFMARSGGHAVDPEQRHAVLSQHQLSEEQRHALKHITDAGDLKVLVGVAGSGKSRSLAAAREVWESQGYRVRGATLAGIAAENLQASSGIESRTLASLELSWQGGRDTLTRKDVLVIDEAGMTGSRQLARVLEQAEKARAKVVLVGDHEQLQAIEAGAPFRAIHGRIGMAELREVRRQHHAWQREATQAFARGDTPDALASYESRGGIVAVQTRDQARTALLARWTKDSLTNPKNSQLILAYTREDVQALNRDARALRQQHGELGKSETIETERGKREIAVGERLYFLRNEKSLGVKNGSLGTVERIRNGVLQVKLDGESERRIAVDTRFYKDLDYGYAATVHKSQGSTVDRTYVLASYHYDRHTTYVGLSRHREAATVFYAREDFGGQFGSASATQVHDRFVEQLSRLRQNDMAHDYLELTAQEPRLEPKAVQPELTIQERFERGFAQGLAGESTATPNHSPAREHDEDTLAARFDQAAERSRLETLERWQRQRGIDFDQAALEARREKQARLELERERERERDRGRDFSL